MLISMVVGMILFAAIGILLVFNIMAAGAEEEVVDFTVEDPSVNKDCSLSNTPSTINAVQYYNGVAWVTLTTAEYTTSGNIITVKASAMD